MPILFLLLIFCFQLHGSESSRQQYLELIKQHPPIIEPQGDFKKGEIEIVTDPEKMAAIEKKMSRDVGLVYQDKYWLWINDACVFPSGFEGVYGRILWVKSLESVPGVAVMPILPDGRVVLNCNFRHSTRSWEIELPRGGVNKGETVEAAAKRECVEETGMVVDSLTLLGEIPPDTGLTNTLVPVFAAKVIGEQKPEQEETEAIEEILALTIEEIQQAFVKGYYEGTVRGVKTKIPFRDPFLAYACLLYSCKKN